MPKLNAKALSALIAVSGAALNPRLEEIILALIDELNSGSEASSDIMDSLQAIMRTIRGDGIWTITQILLDILSSSRNDSKILVCRCLAVLFSENPDGLDELSNPIVEILVSNFSSKEETLVVESWNCFDALVTSLGKESIKIVKSVCNGVEVAARGPLSDIPAFNLPKGLKPVFAVLLQGLTAGSLTEKERSAIILSTIIQRTAPESLKPYVTQVTGSLIRVVGDRLLPGIKIAILSAMG